MSDDRELLELAARAAGITAQWDCPERGMMMLTPKGTDTMSWNPLESDCDALRLAAILNLELIIKAPITYAGLGKQLPVIMEKHDKSGPYAATRRAIVRAAAEIGKEMQ